MDENTIMASVSNLLIPYLCGMRTSRQFQAFLSDLPAQEQTMPVLFIGHGSPMNGIEDNVFSRTWARLGQRLPRPQAVLVISAHWYVPGSNITAMDFPETIHDFAGFPSALYQVQYPAPGQPSLAKEISEHLIEFNLELSHEWGLDHGAWTVLRHLFPDADVPILQLSIHRGLSPAQHYALGQSLAYLRKKGVLLLGSGNMVHNLALLDWKNLHNPGFGFDWALELNQKIKDGITHWQHKPLIQLEELGTAGKLGIPSLDHYLPLLYILGASQPQDPIEYFNDVALAGSLTMTSVMLGKA